MVGLKVEITSRDMIKPSSPTPQHLKTLQLSFLDQFAPPIYIPLIFFYPNKPLDHTQPSSTLLKKSLSNVLVRFYPLAGRVEGNATIICNDKGVEYMEAYVPTNLTEVIENPNLDDLRVLLPFEPISNNNNLVLGVQVNHFSCGGMGISVCISHKIADGTAFVAFVNDWAKETLDQLGFANDDQIVVNPKFDSASHFPPRDLNGIYIPRSSICKEKIVTRRFLFDKEKLEALIEQSSCVFDRSSSKMKGPTRVEVVSGFIWKRTMEVARIRADPTTKISATVHAVNLRNRVAPPIPSDSFGNFWWFTIAPTLVGDKEDYPNLVGKLRESIRKIDDNYVKKLQNGEGLLEIKKVFDENLTHNGLVELCNFSSWCRFPLYEVNFGWGNPIWVCPTTLPFKNVVILLSTRCGEGIEAWVNMLQDDIALLEHDHGLLSLASPSWKASDT